MLQRVADRRQRVAQLVRQRRQELVLAPVGLLALHQVGTRLVLAIARAHGAANGARQCGDAHRALEQRDVAQRANRLGNGPRIGAAPRQNQDRQVRPRRLTRDQGGGAGRPRSASASSASSMAAAPRSSSRATQSRSMRCMQATASRTSSDLASARASLPTGARISRRRSTRRVARSHGLTAWTASPEHR